VRELAPVESADEMYQAVLARAATADIYIGAAAVADYAPTSNETRKIKKDAGEMTLALARTKDILAAVAGLASRPFTVGFAAETHNVEEYARGKLAAKSLDMVAANRVGRGLGFDADDNALFVCWQGGEATLPLAPKRTLAAQLLQLIAQRYHAKDSAQDSR
jgi:phosphopantothenoylcysteine decarboxylase/phosphopantothenate--cysteine ligase